MSWPAVIAPKRAFLLCALVGAIVAALVLALRWRSITEYIVTSAAIADARDKLAKRQPYGLIFETVWDPVASELARDWASWFEAGYLDRRLLLEKLASGRDALESLMVIAAFQQAVEEDGVGPPGIVTWFEAVAQSPEAKDLLVDAFLGPLPWLPPCQDVPAFWNMMGWPGARSEDDAVHRDVLASEG